MTSLWLDRELSVETDPFVQDARFDDVVVGAGLTGLVTALLLSRAGRSVALVEARHIGAVTSGNTTAKISLLQGTHLSKIEAHTSREVAEAYLESNREGQAWLVRYCEANEIGVQRRDAYTYAGTPGGMASVKKELETCHQLGLEVSYVPEPELPFRTFGAVRLPDQAQFNPMDALEVLAADFRIRGGKLHEGVRVFDVHSGADEEIHTSAGGLRATNVVLATGIPFLDRGMYFAKVTPQRSYALAFRVPGPIPQGMYLSSDSPTRSLRTAPRDDEQLLVVGGNGHVVGRHPSPKQQVADLTSWTREYFPGAERTHVWSAQDYEPHNQVPFVGRLPRGGGHVYLGTGYNKWGMTNAVAAALRITAEITGGHLEWAEVLGKRISRPLSMAKSAEANLSVGVEAVRGWATSELKELSEHEKSPAEGEGVVGRVGVKPVAISTVNGRTCSVSAVCPHMGGIVRWNDAELSWDCPLHGSRYAADGTVLEGPATENLQART